MAPMRLTRFLVPTMKEAGEGYIINIASIEALYPYPSVRPCHHSAIVTFYCTACCGCTPFSCNSTLSLCWTDGWGDTILTSIASIEALHPYPSVRPLERIHHGLSLYCLLG